MPIIIDKKISSSQLIKLIESLRIVFFDFDGVFTDNFVVTSQHGDESVRCFRSDGMGLSRLPEVSVTPYIISTETNPVVGVRSKKLNVLFKQGVHSKADAIKEICEDLSIDIKHTAFVGNDINDIPALSLVGVPIAVSDAYPEVQEYVYFRTERRGGFGAVREVADLIYYVKSKRQNVRELFE